MSKPKEINKEMLEKLAGIHCTLEEIAAVFGVGVDLIRNRVMEYYGLSFPDFYDRFSANGKASLRRAMFKNAIDKNNATMQIWLSKQYLGMKDKREDGIDITSKGERIEVFTLDMGRVLNDPADDDLADDTPGGGEETSV